MVKVVSQSNRLPVTWVWDEMPSPYFPRTNTGMLFPCNHPGICRKYEVSRNLRK